jgi:hypothetical protein
LGEIDDPVKLQYAHLADYAANGAGGKLTIVHVFEIVYGKAEDGPVQIPPCYLVAAFTASLSEGSEHQVSITLVDADEKPLDYAMEAQLPFVPMGPGYPLRAKMVIGFGAGALSVPSYGDYAFTFRVNGTEIGRLPFAVIRMAS